MRSARVSVDGQRAGVLDELPNGGARFTYDPKWLRAPGARAISLVMPLRAEPYDSPGLLHPVFLNLLPEGWLLDIALSSLKIAPSDYFGLLLATCHDCVGALEISPR